MKINYVPKSLLVIAVTVAAVSTASASAFWGATVKNVPAGDHLNIRKFAAASSAVLGVYNNGDNVSFTGRCKNNKTFKSFMVDGTFSVLHNYNRMKAANVWCEVFLETPAGSGKFAAGWAKGKFLWPN
jgi:hypothetical protein